MIKKLTAKIDGRGMDNSEILDAILESRGVEDLSEFLYPSESALIPFEELKNIHKAYEIIDEAIMLGENILVLADVDADGACSNAIITRYLRKCGAHVECVINSGKKHGASGFDLSLLKDIDVMIIVDSLDNDPEVYKRILNTGTKLVIFDHHIIERELLGVDLDFVLVSSANNYPNPELSGAGVCLKFCLYCDEQNLTDYADDLWVYGAIGLISDMCSMAAPENRYIAYKGLAQYNNPLIKKMIGNYMFDSQSVSFSISPLVNACMRTNNNELAMNAFLADDEYEIDEYVQTMRQCREEQNEAVESILGDLLAQGEEQLDRRCMFFFLGDVDAEIGGLVGNKLLSIYQRPLFVLRDCDEKWMGSMRAIGVENMLEIVNDTSLGKCAGHELAAGFECDKDKFEEFKIKIEEVLADVDFTTEVVADIEIEPSQVNEALIKSLNALNRISGAGFSPVTVLMRTNDYEVSTFTTKKHTKIIDNNTGALFVKWNCLDYQTMNNDGEFVGVGKLSSPWYGKRQFIQLTIDEYTKRND